MSYIVFARKYRPKTFDEIIGQTHITATLRNAIAQDRVAHAYIFSGPRGVGKTTTARILAKSLNCAKPKGPEPCNSCPSCNEITDGTSLDILEIDGASNRGIDEIRNLRDNVRFAPSKGKFKVYIIDEVHMLTEPAFNALLKTLEEPPPHTIFIFATTQAYKIPPTILSRCQRFDFKRISTKEIFGSLKAIAKDERLSVKDDVLMLISKYADGGMRDAQVILDQIISFTEGKADTADVLKILGGVDEEMLFGLAGCIEKRDASGALGMIDRLIDDGRDPFQVVSGLIEHFRNISVTRISEKPDLLIEAGPDKIKRYRDQGQNFTIEDILYILYTLSNTIDLMRKSNMARIPLEIALVKLTRRGPGIRISDIMERIGRLEEKLGCARPMAADQPHQPKEIRTPPARAEQAPVQEREKKQERRPENPPPSPGHAVAIDEILSYWNGVIDYIKSRKISVASYLQEGYPVAVEGRTLSVGFPKECQFHKEVLESPENRRLIEEALKYVLNNDLKISLTLAEPSQGRDRAHNGERSTDDGEGGGAPSGDGPKRGVDPIIETALEIFGGEVSEPRPNKGRAR
ncbi:MAG: DNA polymerase III subunit gamma/tau [Candidatus Omnitrophota bacterium]